MYVSSVSKVRVAILAMRRLSQVDSGSAVLLATKPLAARLE